jgi:hypothetical protein
LRWGATGEEVAARLPGDKISPDAAAQVTHAITINAPPQCVWPWILQIGQDRGGFYSYTSLENMAGCEMHNVRRIVPEWQNRAAGDIVWFATPRHFGAVPLTVNSDVSYDAAGYRDRKKRPSVLESEITADRIDELLEMMSQC